MSVELLSTSENDPYVFETFITYFMVSITRGLEELPYFVTLYDKKQKYL
jgi:hypothetical protein